MSKCFASYKTRYECQVHRLLLDRSERSLLKLEKLGCQRSEERLLWGNSIFSAYSRGETESEGTAFLSGAPTISPWEALTYQKQARTRLAWRGFTD